MARILIVEDEALIALGLEAAIEDLGHTPVGVAPDAAAALALAAAEAPDLALVDVNLRDGATGPAVGARLAAGGRGVTVLFLTANPDALGPGGVPGTLGVLTKPCGEAALAAALSWAWSARRRADGGAAADPPPGLTAFPPPGPTAFPPSPA